MKSSEILGVERLWAARYRVAIKERTMETRKEKDRYEFS